MPHGSTARRPQSAGPARPRSKPSWDSTNSDLEQLRLSKDDLRLKLQSRQHKPLSEYKGPLNIVKKQRPDGTEYVVGVNSRPAPAKPAADLRQTIKGKAAAGKENARGAREEEGSSESEAAGRALQAAAEAYIEVMRIPAVSSTLPAPGADQSFDDEPVPAPPAPASAPGVDVPTFLAQVFSHAEAAAAGREVGAQQQHGGGIASSSSSSSSAAAAAPGLGRPVRQPVPGIARRAAAAVENREVEMANLADVCEELRCTMVKYEFATGRQDTAPGLFRRPVQQGYTEFLYKTSMRLFEYLGESDKACEALEKRVEGAEYTANEALAMISQMKSELDATKEALKRQQETEDERVDERMRAVEEDNRGLGRKVAFLEKSLEFQNIDSLLSSTLSAPRPHAPAPAPAPTPAPAPAPAATRHVRIMEPSDDVEEGPEPVPIPHARSNPAPFAELPSGLLSPVEESPRAAEARPLTASVVIAKGGGRLAPGKLVHTRPAGAQV